MDNEIVGEVRLPKNQVVLVGGTLISRMDKYGYFEHAATVSWPHHDISFRNLGWAADDVFGTARSEFGSAHNTRSWQPPKNQRGFGFEKLRAQLDETDPATIIVGYGAEAAFADTDEKRKRFEAGYRGLVEELEETGAKLILLSPLAQVSSGAVIDGNEVATDTCTTQCLLATCGDGFIREDLAEGDDGFEVCDDGNTDDDDACYVVRRLAAATV